MSEYEQNNKELQSNFEAETTIETKQESVPVTLSPEQVIEQTQIIDTNIVESESNIADTSHKLAEVRASMDLPDPEEQPHSILSSEQRIDSLQIQKSEINSRVEQSIIENSSQDTESAKTSAEKLWRSSTYDPEYQKEVQNKLDELERLNTPRSDGDYGVSFNSRDEAFAYGNQKDQIYKDFATKYPHKADAYADRNQDLKHAIPFWIVPTKENENSEEVHKFKELYPKTYQERWDNAVRSEAFKESEERKREQERQYLMHTTKEEPFGPKISKEDSQIQKDELNNNAIQESKYSEESISSDEKQEFAQENETILPYKDQRVESSEQVISRIGEQISERSREDIDSLKKLDIIDSGIFRSESDATDNESSFSWAETDKIIGRPFAKHQIGGWAHEYETRPGRINEIAEEIGKADQENLEEVFHADKPNERIKLTAIDGPKGPIYLVEDGTHRISGAKMAGLKEVPCEIHRKKYPQHLVSKAKTDVYEWERKIKLGLIDGEVKIVKSSDDSEFYRLDVKKEVVPWMSMASQNDFVEMSKKYEKLYPGSLDNLPIPRDALVDSVANNHFLSGKWEDWVTKYSENKRDEEGVVEY